MGYKVYTIKIIKSAVGYTSYIDRFPTFLSISGDVYPGHLFPGGPARPAFLEQGEVDPAKTPGFGIIVGLPLKIS